MKRSLYLLGNPYLESGGERIALATRKALALLAYVAVERNGASRAELASLLWPENPEDQARASLRQELSRLNQHMGEALQKPSQQMLQLSPNWIEVDLWAFQDALEAKQYQQALELYRGGFLQGLQLRDSGEFESWQQQFRENLAQQYLGALYAQAQLEESGGNLAQALTLHRQAIATDPLAERHYAAAIRILEAQGDHASAVRLKQSLSKAMNEELGLVEVSNQTPSFPANLPLPSTPPLSLSPLIGRTQEITDLLALLARPDCRLLNLLGPGGIGKTRIAQALAQEVSETKVLWTSLNGRALLPALIESLGLQLRGQGSALEAVAHQLRSEAILLILDEAEEMRETGELEELLRAAPQLKIVLTSRVRFRLRSEWVYEVKGLDFPEEDRLIQRSTAAELFRRSAKRADPRFNPSTEDWAAIAQICRLLSGLPLGLELAAALTRVMNCHEIAEQLSQDLGLLEGTLSDLPSRHSSLSGVLESSLGQLEPQQRQTLVNLAVFEGTFGLEAAKAVAVATPQVLGTLLDRALLQKQPEGYRILTVIRQHLLPQIPAPIHQAHAEYFAHQLKAHEQGMRGGNQGGALPLFTRQFPDLKAAWNWAIAGEQHEVAIEMIDGLFLIFELRGWFGEGEAMMAQAAAAPNPLLRSLALGRQGRLEYRLGESTKARQSIGQSLEVGQGLIDQYELAFALNNLGMAHLGLGEAERAKELFTQSMTMRRQQNRPWGLGNALYNLGSVALLQGVFAEAQGYLQESLEVYRSLGDLRGISLALAGLGQAWTSLGEYALAKEMFRQSLSYGEQLADPFAEANAHLGLGTVAGIERRNEDCQQHLQASLEAAYQTGDSISIGRALVGLGRLAMRDEKQGRGYKLHRQALERFQASRYPWGEALAYVHLGRSFAAAGETAEARAHYRMALEKAQQLGAKPMILRALAGLLPMLSEKIAAPIVALIAAHPSTDAWVREEMKARASLQRGKREEGKGKSKALSLEEAVQMVLKAL